MTTKELEHVAYKHLMKMGTYLCFEVMMPSEYYSNNERVDLLSYDTNHIWRFYELKVSKSDFHSKAKKTFLGHFNYYIMPYDLYVQVKDEIPKEIGVYAASQSPNNANRFWMECVKKPVKQELRIDHNKLMFSFMQSLSREYQKYRRHLREESEKPKKVIKKKIIGESYEKCNHCRHTNTEASDEPCLSCRRSHIDKWEPEEIDWDEVFSQPPSGTQSH